MLAMPSILLALAHGSASRPGRRPVPVLIIGLASRIEDGRRRRLLRLEQRVDELAAGRGVPAARADYAPDELAAAVHEIHRGRPEHAVATAGHLTALVEQHRCGVAALLDRLPHEIGTLPEIDQDDLETLALQLARDLVDGRQLLPTVRSPGGPEEQHHDLAPEIGELDRLAVQIGQGEGWRGLGRVVGDDLHRGEVRRGERGRGAERHSRHRDGEEPSAHHAAPESFSAFTTSSALRRFSGLSMILMYFTVPVLSMMKYARFAYRYTGLCSFVSSAPYAVSI